MPGSPFVSRAAHGARHGLLRAYAAPRAHEIVPLSLAFRGIDAFVRAIRRREHPLFTQTRDFHAELLRHTPLAGTEDDVAERTLAEVLKGLEIFFRPPVIDSGRIEGHDHIRAARSSGRATVMVFPRFNVSAIAAPILRSHDIETYTMVMPHHYSDDNRGFDAVYARRAAELFDFLGRDHIIVRSKGSGSTFEQSNALLQQQKNVAFAWDAAGKMPTPFLGRTVMLASGPVKLAMANDALVLPWVLWRRGAVPVIHAAPPIDSRDHADPSALQAAIAEVVERFALEKPENVWPLLAEPGGPPLVRDAATPAAATG